MAYSQSIALHPQFSILNASFAFSHLTSPWSNIKALQLFFLQKQRDRDGEKGRQRQRDRMWKRERDRKTIRQTPSDKDLDRNTEIESQRQMLMCEYMSVCVFWRGASIHCYRTTFNHLWLWCNHEHVLQRKKGALYLWNHVAGAFYDFLLGFCNPSKTQYVWMKLVIYFKNDCAIFIE